MTFIDNRNIGISLLVVFNLLYAGDSVLEIISHGRHGNTVSLQCRENHFNGEPLTVLRNVSLFLFNSTGRLVTSLLEENHIRPDFDLDSDGKLNFDVQQNIEGYYYCSRDMSAGVPSDYETILGKCFIYK